MNLYSMLPEEIEQKSFEIIESELPHEIDKQYEAIIKRVIHTTADFEYIDNLKFSDDALDSALSALRKGACIITDTNMVKSGVNKTRLAGLNCTVECFMADADVMSAAKENGTTRAVASMEKAAKISGNLIFAIGNAPTALAKLCEMIDQKKISPALVIGVPVGFVNVVEAKELLMKTKAPYIVAKGRKGGSNVAAAICNALLIMAEE